MKVTAKLIMLICNVASAALCIMAIIGNVAGPIMKTTTTITVNQAVLDLIFEKDGETNGESAEVTGAESGESTSESESESDIIKGILTEMAKDEAKLQFSFELSTGVFLNALTSNDVTLIDKFLDDMIEKGLGDDFKKQTDKFMESAMKSATKTILFNKFDDLRKNNPELDEMMGDKNAKEFLEDAGVTEEYVDTQIGTVYSALTTDKTVTEAASDVTGVVKDLFDKVKTSEYGEKNPEAFDNSDEKMAALEENITSLLVYLTVVGSGEKNIDEFKPEDVTPEMIEASKNSTVNLGDAVEGIVMGYINKALGEADGNDNNPSSPTIPEGFPDIFGGMSVKSGLLATSMNFGAFDRADAEIKEGTSESGEGGETESGIESGAGETDKESSYEQIKSTVKDKIKSVIPDNFKKYGLIAMKVVGGFIIFNALIWAYLLLKLIVNTLNGKMKTKMKLAYSLGWENGFNLVILPTILYKTFTSHNFITEKLFAGKMHIVDVIGKTLNLSFASGAVFAFWATVGLIAIAIVRSIFVGIFSDGSEAIK